MTERKKQASPWLSLEEARRVLASDCDHAELRAWIKNITDDADDRARAWRQCAIILAVLLLAALAALAGSVAANLQVGT